MALPLGGMLAPITGTLDSTLDSVLQSAEGLDPGISNGATLTGNILGSHGITDDVLGHLGQGDLTGAISEAYSDTLLPGGVVPNLADGGGTGLEGLVDGLLSSSILG